MSVVLSEHLPLLAAAPNGIQKLRGLILELAVRGKLVPQDPNDEPASELLKRIAKERARLEAEGVFKSSKAIPLDESDWPFELPIDWKWCRFPDVANYKMGKTPPTKEAAYWADDGIPWVSISDMSHGQRIVTTSRTVSNAAREKVFRSAPAPAGTLLMSFKLTVGKVAALGIDAFHNEAIISIFPFKGVSQEFLSHFLPMIARGGNSKSALMGDTLNSESLALLCIPLPPLAEQHRIVAKVDELMALCDRLEQEVGAGETAHAKLVETLLGTLTQSTAAADLAANWQRLAEHFETLFTTEASIDALKQTVLQLAVMGKLVPQDPNDEPASEILETIRKTRNTLYATKKISKPKELPALDDSELPFALPNGWTWCMLGDLCYQVSDGPHFSPQYVTAKEGVPFLSTRNVRSDGFDLASLKYVSRADHEEFCKRIRPEKGDVIYTKGGTTGIAKVNDLDFEFSVWVHLAVLRIEKNRLLPRYVELALNSPHCYAQSQHYTQGISNFDLGLTRMIKITTPLPPLAEQHRIVAKVDELMALCDHLIHRLTAARKLSSKLACAVADVVLEPA